MSYLKVLFIKTLKIMKEKFNNFEYIYTYMQLFYRYTQKEIYKSVLTNITRNILKYVFSNISIDDLKILISNREKIENLKRKENYTQLDIKQSFKIKSSIENITNKNVDKFLKNPDDTIINTIFILF